MIINNTLFRVSDYQDDMSVNELGYSKSALIIVFVRIIIAEIPYNIDRVISRRLLIPDPDLLFCIFGYIFERTHVADQDVIWITSEMCISRIPVSHLLSSHENSWLNQLSASNTLLGDFDFHIIYLHNMLNYFFLFITHESVLPFVFLYYFNSKCVKMSWKKFLGLSSYEKKEYHLILRVPQVFSSISCGLLLEK